MSRKIFILDLAKLVISAAWADGDLSNDEINALKDLLFRLEDISADDWSILSMYMESPVSEDEKNELLEKVTRAIRTNEDKEVALKTLEHLFHCDGAFTPEETALMDEIRGEISGVATGMFSGFSKALRSAIVQREKAVHASCLREHGSEDYVQNTIYYDLVRYQKDSGDTFNKPEEDLRKLCLATGLLSHVAHVDEEISDGEVEAIRSIIAQDWGLAKEQAELLTDIACKRTTRGLDYVRLSNNYFTATTINERIDFIKTLFRVANAENKTDHHEIEEIRRIANSLKVTHQQFIDAKLTIPREDRKGL